MSAVIQNEYTGNNSTTTYSFTFPYLKTSDIKASLDGVDTTAFTLPNATTLQFNTAPGSGVKIKIFRQTSVDDLTATFYAGSAIKSEDLNDNFTQNLYKTQEVGARFVSNLGGTMTGDLNMGEDTVIKFEGATDNAHETTLTVADPTADRTITLPNVTGTVVTTGDTGTVATAMIANNAVTGDKIADDQINSEHYIDGSIDTQHIANAQITTAKIADSNVTTGKINDGAVTTAKLAAGAATTVKIADSAINTNKLAADAVTNAKIADNSIDSEHYVDGSIDNAHLADNSVTLAKMADDSVGTAELVDGSVDTARLADNSVTLAKMVDNSVGTSELVDAAVTTAKLASNAVSTVKIANDAITNAKLAPLCVGTAELGGGQVTDAKLATGAVTTAKIADSGVTTAKIANGAVTTAKIADSGVTSAKIANDAVGSSKVAAGAIDTVHVGAAQITTAKIAASAVATSKLNNSAVTTDKITDNAVTINKIGCEQTTLTDSDSHIPTSGAVVDYVAAQIAPLGGLEVIATEVAFPNTQPASGVVISISDAGGVVVNGSGVSTTGRTVGGSTVTINGFPASLQSKTMAAGIGLMVSSTGSGQTYTYHKILAKEADVEQLSNDINDFAQRYRVGSSNPTSNNDAGDLFFNTSTSKLLVYNATNSAWEEAQSIGNFFISTFSEAFDGSRTQFTLSNAPANVQQILLSLNGVVQKPGTAFTLSGSTVTLASAPASGTDYFAVVMGSTVNIGQPSNNTVSTAVLQDDAVTSAKIAASNVTATELGANAVISSKIADDAVTAAKIGTLTGDVDFNDNAKARFGTGNDLRIYHDGSDSIIQGSVPTVLRSNTLLLKNFDNSHSYVRCNNGGNVELYHNNSKKLETTSSGINVTGDLVTTGHVHIPDSYRLKVGNATNGDLILIHDGTDSIIDNATGNLFIRSGSLHLQSTAAENMVVGEENGAVELYHNNIKKFETRSGGVGVFGHIEAGDSNKLMLGDSNDLQLYHNGTNSFVNNTTSGKLMIQNASGNIQFEAKNGEDSCKMIPDGAVELYHDNNKKFETTSSGVTVSSDNSTGSLLKGVTRFCPSGSTTVKAMWDPTGFSGGGHLQVKDNVAFAAGDSSDLQIYHDGGDSFIRDTGVGGIRIDSNQTVLRNAAGDEHIIETAENGAVKLFYNGANRLETRSQGVKINVTGSEGVLITGATGTTETLHMQNTSSGGLCQMGMQTQDSDGLHHRAYIISKRDGGNYSGSLHLVTRGKTMSDGGFVLSSHNNFAKFQYHVLPYSNNSYTLGNGSLRWGTVYSVNNLNTSDKNLKNSIQDSDLGLSFINKLRPVSYKWDQKEGETADTKTHYGFIAQEVETAIKSESKTLDDFAGVFKPDNYKEDGSGDAMAIAIAEIVSPLVKAVQELSAKVTALEAK